MIVSAYYKIPSKQPHSFYVNHLKRWFRALTVVPVIFFTTDDVKEEIISWGYPMLNIEFIILPLTAFSAWDNFGREFWDRQKLRDPEPYHTPELAAIWYEKKEFVRRAMDKYPDEKAFIWCDAGCIRDDICESVARAGFSTRKGNTLDDGRLHLQLINRIPYSRFYKYPDMSIAGAIIAGNRIAWQEHSVLYDNILCEYDAAAVCGNSDQYIIKSCTDREPDKYVLHPPPHGTIINKWFFFLQCF